MTESFNNGEILSAFLDGELTSAESAQVQGRLETDGAAREELERLRALGPLLQALPRHTPGDEFRAAVMQRCERESLLPGDPIERSAEPQTAKSWGPLMGSILATAAMLFLALRVATTPTQHTPGESAPRVADNHPKPNIEHNRIALKMPDKNAGDNAGKQTPSQDGVARNSVKRRFEAGSANGNFAGSNDAAPGAGERLFGGFGGGRGAGARPPAGFGGAMLDESMRDTLRLGDVIPYLAITGERTAVVEVMVIDVRPAADKLEVLLHENKVYSGLPADRKSGRPTAAGATGPLELKLNKDTGADGRMQAVYVELTQAQLAAVMRQVGRKTNSLRVSLRPPVELGDVPLSASLPSAANATNAPAKRGLTLADAVRAARQSARDRPMTAAAGPGKRGGTRRNKTRKPDNGTKTHPKPVPNDNVKSAPDSAKTAATAAARSFRLRFDLDERSTLLSTAERAKKPETGQRFVRRTRGRKALAANSPPAAPVHVIFVFRKPAKPAQAPAGKPKR